MDTSLFNGGSSFPVVGERESSSATWFSILVGCMTSNSIFDIHKHQWTSFPVVSIMFRIQCIPSWSARTVNQNTSRYGCNRSTVHTKARNSWLIVLYACSALFRDQDQYPTAFAGLFDMSWSIMHPICVWPVSVSIPYCLVGIGKESSGGDKKLI